MPMARRTQPTGAPRSMTKTAISGLALSKSTSCGIRATNKPLGFPAEGYPEPQGPYYCGVGANECLTVVIL